MSSSSSVTTTTVNGTTRITGLSSGLDVDGIVEQLMVAEKSKKLNKLQQKQQTAEWTQEAYRSIISDIQDFSSKYFDVTSSSSIMKASNFLQYSSSSSDSAVSVTSTSTASAGNHKISVSQLATAAKVTSDASISKDVQGSSVPDYTSLSGTSFVINLDGTKRTVTLNSVTGLDSLQSAIDDAVGLGKVTVSMNDSNFLEITAADDGVQAITISAPSSGTSGLTKLGFGTDAVLSNRLSTTDTLATIAGQLSSSTALTFNDDGQVDLTINGTQLSFDQDSTLAEMISKVNKADLGATMDYNTITGELTLTATDTGAGNSLAVTDSGTSNFAALLLSTSTAGLDARMIIDGQSLPRSSNSITIDGVTYTANAETEEDVAVTVTQNTDGVYDLISNFVDAYNTLIETINTAISENADSDYPPLTDDEKAEMTEEEITAWEVKAKVGLLESDPTLRTFLSDMRTALIDSVFGQTSSLASIGITSGTYDKKGTLSIDEDTLTAAIASDPKTIMELFTQQATSTTASGTPLAGTAVVRKLSSSDLSTRYKEEGIAYRFYDILQKNISTIRDSSGNKGTLLVKAGTENDVSDTDNTLSTLLEKYAKELEDEQDRLDEFEERLYTKYTTLETYINTMNAQLSALSSLVSS